jgi:rubrerythrin
VSKLEKLEDLYICEKCGYEVRNGKMPEKCPKCGGEMKKVVVVR